MQNFVLGITFILQLYSCFIKIPTLHCFVAHFDKSILRQGYNDLNSGSLD